MCYFPDATGFRERERMHVEKRYFMEWVRGGEMEKFSRKYRESVSIKWPNQTQFSLVCNHRSSIALNGCESNDLTSDIFPSSLFFSLPSIHYKTMTVFFSTVPGPRMLLASLTLTSPSLSVLRFSRSSTRNIF
jgi:hypothetical protein